MSASPLREPNVITALGFSAPWGEGLEAFAACAPAGEARAFSSYNTGERLPARGLRYVSAVTQLFCSTAMQALDSVGARTLVSEAPERVGIYHGADSPHLDDAFRFDLIAKLDGPDHASPMASPNTLPNAAVGELAIRLQLAGPSLTVACGPSSGMQALDLACLDLDAGRVDYALVGSVELSSMYHQSLWRAVDPDGAVSRCAELSVVLCVEPLRRARAAGRRVLAQVLGTAGAALREPADAERSALRALEDALRDARLPASTLDLLLLAGARPGFDADRLALLLAERARPTPVLSLDQRAGQTENTGGLLGVAWALALFRNAGRPAALWGAELLDTDVVRRLRCIGVSSTDAFDNSSAVLLAPPEEQSC
jgi:3-oxoacyl-[acyl-carrier-protein] synthase II